MSAMMVEVEKLDKSFPVTSSLRALFKKERKQVLHGIDLHIRSNEIFGLLGPNGAGKSTLIKILCTLIRPTAGKALVDGHDIMRESAKVRGLIGLVNCDDRSYYWRLSGRENMRFYAALSRVPANRSERRIDELLELTGLREAADVRMSEYSSGMKQRLSIARGLLGDPKLLFMDEPTRSLDPIGAYELRTFIRDRIVRQEGRTVVLATNIMDEAELLCDRLALINHGTLYAAGTVSELSYALAPNEHYALTVGELSPEQLNSLGNVPGVVSVEWSVGENDRAAIDLYMLRNTPALPGVMRRIVEMGGEVWACNNREVTLEEVFRTMLGTRTQMVEPERTSMASELRESVAV